MKTAEDILKDNQRDIVSISWDRKLIPFHVAHDVTFEDCCDFCKRKIDLTAGGFLLCHIGKLQRCFYTTLFQLTNK